MDLIEIYDLKSNDWRITQLATAADKRNAIPEPRVKPCSVIARAKDGSSYNIYMFGGWNPDPNSSAGYSEMWVLSIPSFKWFLVNIGTSTMPGSPPKYEAMTCYIVGGGSKMLVYGGGPSKFSFDGECDRTGIHVFDMINLAWEVDYDANGGEYKVPKEIYNVIGGGPYGGATLLPENGMANSDIEAKFKDIIAKTNTNSTRTNTSDPASGDTIPDLTTESPKSGVSGGTIAGIVVGVVIGISLVALGILWFRKQSKARARRGGFPGSESNDNPPAEIASIATLPPGELHPYGFLPSAQELHGYMPNELVSQNDGVYTEGPYDKPTHLELSARGTEAGEGESVQYTTYSDHRGESIQAQS